MQRIVHDQPHKEIGEGKKETLIVHPMILKIVCLYFLFDISHHFLKASHDVLIHFKILIGNLLNQLFLKTFELYCYTIKIPFFL